MTPLDLDKLVEAMARAMDKRLFKIIDAGRPGNWMGNKAYDNALIAAERLKRQARAALIPAAEAMA